MCVPGRAKYMSWQKQHVFLLWENACSAVEQELIYSCWTRPGVFLLNKAACILVWENTRTSLCYGNTRKNKCSSLCYDNTCVLSDEAHVFFMNPDTCVLVQHSCATRAPAFCLLVVEPCAIVEKEYICSCLVRRTSNSRLGQETKISLCPAVHGPRN